MPSCQTFALEYSRSFEQYDVYISLAGLLGSLVLFLVFLELDLPLTLLVTTVLTVLTSSPLLPLLAVAAAAAAAARVATPLLAGGGDDGDEVANNNEQSSKNGDGVPPFNILDLWNSMMTFGSEGQSYRHRKCKKEQPGDKMRDPNGSTLK